MKWFVWNAVRVEITCVITYRETCCLQDSSFSQFLFIAAVKISVEGKSRRLSIAISDNQIRDFGGSTQPCNNTYLLTESESFMDYDKVCDFPVKTDRSRSKWPGMPTGQLRSFKKSHKIIYNLNCVLSYDFF